MSRSAGIHLREDRMRGLALAAIAMALGMPLADASGSCPVTLIDGTGDQDTFTVSFQNAGKLPIRRLDLSGKLLSANRGAGQLLSCQEENALFYPGTVYTLRCTTPRGTPRSLGVSLKHVAFSDGGIWTQTQHQACPVIRVRLAKPRK